MSCLFRGGVMRVRRPLVHEGLALGRMCPAAMSDIRLAERVVAAIDSDGGIAHLAVSVDLLDPGAVRFWVRSVLGDYELDEVLAEARGTEYSALLAQRRAQCVQFINEPGFLKEAASRGEGRASERR